MFSSKRYFWNLDYSLELGSPYHGCRLNFCPQFFLLRAMSCCIRWFFLDEWSYYWTCTIQQKWTSSLIIWVTQSSKIDCTISLSQRLEREIFQLSICLFEQRLAIKKYNFSIQCVLNRVQSRRKMISFPMSTAKCKWFQRLWSCTHGYSGKRTVIGKNDTE